MAKSYINDDLMVLHRTYYENDFERLNNRNTFIANRTFISIFCVLNGEATVKYANNVKKLKKNELIAVENGVGFSYTLPKNKEYDGLQIVIHPSLLNDFEDDKFFLRGLQLPDEAKVINLEKHEFSLIKDSVYSLVKCTELEFGKKHHIPRINVILSELCIYYDSLFSLHNESTDSISVRIIDYIDRHYTENIGFKEITEQFFVSKTTVNTIVRLYTGVTLQKYIELQRLRDAHHLISHQHIPLIKISQMCGFSTYSTFYRAYVRKYGHPPVNEKVKRKNAWPLS